MSNIFKIEKDLLELFDELEENGGEVTPELEEKLTITQDEFKRKVYGYTNVIKSLQNDLSSIEEEQARLKTLYEKKEKIVNKLKETIIYAVNLFGDTKKSGVKYFDYGIGEVSIRKTQAVEVNNDLIKAVQTELIDAATFNKSIKGLDYTDHVDLTRFAERYNNDNNTNVVKEELDDININLSVSIPVKDLSTGVGYPALKEVVKYSDTYNLSADVSKSSMKYKLKENGACAPNLAKLVQNESLIIK